MHAKSSLFMQAKSHLVRSSLSEMIVPQITPIYVRPSCILRLYKNNILTHWISSKVILLFGWMCVFKKIIAYKYSQNTIQNFFLRKSMAYSVFDEILNSWLQTSKILQEWPCCGILNTTTFFALFNRRFLSLTKANITIWKMWYSKCRSAIKFIIGIF